MIKLVKLLELGINKGVTNEELFNLISYEIPPDIWNDSQFFKEYYELKQKYVPNFTMMTVSDLNKKQTNSFYYEIKKLIKKYE